MPNFIQINLNIVMLGCGPNIYMGLRYTSLSNSFNLGLKMMVQDGAF
jgi:hypothetical protein